MPFSIPSSDPDPVYWGLEEFQVQGLLPGPQGIAT